MKASLGLFSSRSLLPFGPRGACASIAINHGAKRLSTSCFELPQTRSIDSSWRFSRATRSPVLLSCAGFSSRSSSDCGSRTYATQARNIITRFEDLPESYRDSAGLPFRKSDLSASEVRRTFGPQSKTAAMNRLLKILHGRRVAGTLDDPSYQGNTEAFSKYEVDKALQYLRAAVPVDEVLNAGLRAEEELAALESEASGELDAVEEKEGAVAAARASGPQAAAAAASDSVYGQGVFDQIRAKNIARRQERERLEALERAEREAARPGPLAKASDLPRQPSAQMQKWLEEGSSGMQEPPQMTFTERLLPSTVFVVLLAGAVAAFGAVYSPPADFDRLFPELTPARATVGALVALNLAVALAWKVPPLWKFLNAHFVLTHAVPRAPSLLLSTISHSTFWSHFVPNMVGLAIFGTLLHDDVGRANFLAIYIASGAFGFLASLWHFTLRGVLLYSTMGASGGVYGAAGAYFWLHRFDSFKILGFPPAPLDGPQGLGFIALAVGLHLWAMTRKGKLTTDLTSHMAGMAAGIAGAALVQRRQQSLAAAAGLQNPLASEKAAERGGEAKKVDLVKDITVTKAGRPEERAAKP